MRVLICTDTTNESISKILAQTVFNFEQNIEFIICLVSNTLASRDSLQTYVQQTIPQVDGAILVYSNTSFEKNGLSNLMLNYGLTLGILGEERIRIISINHAELPAGILSSTFVELGNPNESTFLESGKSRVYPWFQTLTKRISHQKNNSGQEQIIHVLEDLKIKNPDYTDRIDQIVLELLKRIPQRLLPIDYANNGLIESISSLLLDDCTSMMALDVIGPSGWISPLSFRYLASQLKVYLRKNITLQNEWDLRVSPETQKVIDLAIQNAKASGLAESFTEFDNPNDFVWGTGNVSLEYVRVLLWDQEELLSPIAESIIAIHEAFHVPLFYIEIPPSSPKREIDYILFESPSKGRKGLLGRKEKNYNTEPVERGFELTRLFKEMRGFLRESHIMFAIDARELIKSGEWPPKLPKPITFKSKRKDS